MAVKIAAVTAVVLVALVGSVGWINGDERTPSRTRSAITQVVDDPNRGAVSRAGKEDYLGRTGATICIDAIREK